NPIKVVTQTEGLKRYIGYEVSLKNASLLNYQTFNLASFFVDILDFISNIESSSSFTSFLDSESSKDTDKKSAIKKNDINQDFSRIKENVSWFLYFYLKVSYDNLLLKEEKFIDNEIRIDERLLNFSLFFSDLFEQYETYRDLDKWLDLGNVHLKDVDLKILIKKIIKNDVLSVDEQSYLIKKIIEQNDITRYALKGKISSFVEKIEKNKLEKEKVENFSKLPVYFIGIDSIPLIYLDILIILSRVMTINFYFLLPEYLLLEIQKAEVESYLFSRNIIDSTKTSNIPCQDAINYSTIGKSCTEYIKDFIFFFIYYLGENNCKYEISIYSNSQKDLNLDSSKGSLDEKETLLSKYKRFISNPEIFQLNQEDKKELEDDSIQIFSCYTNLRELEIVKDKISEILKNNEDISVDDIVILASDPQKYLPFIDYLFLMQEPYIPLKTATQFSYKAKKLLEVLLKFLDLMESRFEKSKFFNFINLDLVKEKFKIS
ncbi:MAG TPA: exodeoxyribonuclease V subunit gamma, partial [Exilispira sp.]|nr:exodeoxyribonuclease V subunit gamma [Exilispira sp.]